MYGGKNTLIRRGVNRREACSPDVILMKNLFFISQPLRPFLPEIWRILEGLEGMPCRLSMSMC